MKTTLEVTDQAAEEIRRHITDAIHNEGLDFRYSQKSAINDVIRDTLLIVAARQKQTRPAGRPYVVIENGQIVTGGRRL